MLVIITIPLCFVIYIETDLEITQVRLAKFNMLRMLYMCIICASFQQRQVQQWKKSVLTGLLLDLFRGSANVALVHFGGESQRVQGLAEALLLGTDVDEHQGLRVAPKAVLQQVGQLRVAVGHVGGLQQEVFTQVILVFYIAQWLEQPNTFWESAMITWPRFERLLLIAWVGSLSKNQRQQG